MAFVRKNTRSKTIIDPMTGTRTDRNDYPMTAVCEAILNALVHRDYSLHTEGIPVQLLRYRDRFKLRNPGGLYGRIRVDQLGKIQPDTRNPVLAMAVLSKTENRYSGIPTIRRELSQAEMPSPEFRDERGSFIVCFHQNSNHVSYGATMPDGHYFEESKANDLLQFCSTPRTRSEIAAYLGLSSIPYAIRTHVMLLVDAGLISLSIPSKPRRPKQLYTAANALFNKG